MALRIEIHTGEASLDRARLARRLAALLLRGERRDAQAEQTESCPELRSERTLEESEIRSLIDSVQSSET